MSLKVEAVATAVAAGGVTGATCLTNFDICCEGLVADHFND